MTGQTEGRPPRPGRLSLRMGLALCLGAAAILLAAGAWNLRLQRAHLTRLVALSADRIAETVRTSTRDSMLRNDREAVHRIIANIGSQQGIERIRIFDKRGAIRTSTRADEVGHLLDVRAEQCFACHQRDRPLERLERSDRVRVFDGGDGKRVLGVIAPIHNEPPCTACHAHPPSQTLLGVLDVQLSMASVDQALAASERQMLGGLAATVLAVLALAGALAWWMVLGPVTRLTHAMSRVAAGDLSVRVPVSSTDEIGRMASSWNAMTTDLARTRAELTEWNRTLEERVRAKTADLERAHRRLLVVEKMASLGKLAAVVAHELNNPLAGIRTYARLLRRRLRSAPPDAAAPSGSKPGLTADPEAERILEAVDAEAGRCGEIVRNLLTFSRASPARFSEEDPAPILERCGFLLRHHAEMLGVELRVEAAEPLPRLVCDAAQVQQMLLALAMNALEATPSGGRVALAARAAEGGEGVVLTVADTGCGIPPENLPRLFEPFFTTKEQGKGVGLGLAVAYGIVTRHGGAIEVDSTPGAGTVFTVRLPRRPPPEGAAAGAPAEEAP